jgi:hypothetical protein
LLQNGSSLAFTQTLHLQNIIVELTSSDNLGDDVEVDIILKEFKDAHNVGVVGSLQNLKLILHKVNEDLVLADVRLVNGFDSTVHLGLLVEGFSHFSERALAQNFTDLIVIRQASNALEALEEAKSKHFLHLNSQRGRVIKGC